MQVDQAAVASSLLMLCTDQVVSATERREAVARKQVDDSAKRSGGAMNATATLKAQIEQLQVRCPGLSAPRPFPPPPPHAMFYVAICPMAGFGERRHGSLLFVGQNEKRGGVTGRG